ncbi:DoxX family protein [Novosphingobium resinovorum]|jgi:putative oxidoreductase|uniref:DoxX n=1 Tax=Novosphingobium resinovorum TaxID=158500 RepID=A0A031JUQ3_9SPHN|nr:MULTISPECIES: DoxX family protein [Sphingomonadaceae]AOR79447.1 LysR family transcriptional regulator [Novosphingobium resinovorum]EJU12793.1 DoxX [Sphingomonas sp. LH128]EZP80619.1 DoxX [Novosphingobium resinovorum]MBF7013640.1 DoxX family protein [Novosphingobium sp. HR1a]WJM25789.1 DoxX family protein [Novosphingobium resinovorum]
MTITTIDTAPVAPANTASTLEAWLPLVGRVLIAAIFIISGLSKIADPAGSMAYIASVGLPLPAVALAGAILVEVVGGALLISGYKVRAVATVIALFSLATAAFFHNNLADQNQFIHFFKNIAIAGGLLQIVAFGKARA